MSHILSWRMLQLLQLLPPNCVVCVPPDISFETWFILHCHTPGRPVSAWMHNWPVTWGEWVIMGEHKCAADWVREWAPAVCQLWWLLLHGRHKHSPVPGPEHPKDQALLLALLCLVHWVTVVESLSEMTPIHIRDQHYNLGLTILVWEKAVFRCSILN